MPGIWQGFDEAEAWFRRQAAEASKQSRVALAGAAAIIEAAAKANFVGSHAKGKPHVGGDKPNVVTGTLRRSIKTEPISSTGLGVYRTVVAPTTVYGRRIELGYGRISRPFPYFDPAVKSAHARVETFANSCWAKVRG